MKVATWRHARLVAGVILTAGLLGCFPSRSEIYSELNQSRLSAYTRWQSQTGEEEKLPCMKGDLSIEDAIKVTLVHSPTIAAVLEEKEKARGQVLQAYGEALPSVDLNADYTRLDQVSSLQSPFGSFSFGNKDNWSYGVSVTQPLFKGESIPAAIRGAQLARFLSDEMVRQTVQDVILAVARAYYDVLLAQRLYEVQEQSLVFAEANLKDVLAREQAGVAVPFDTLRARVEVSNVKADMIKQRNLLNRARTALFLTMGVSQRSVVDLADELTYEPMEPSFEEAVRTAFMNRPQLYQGELNVRLQQEALRVYRSDYWPNLEAWGSQMWAKPDPHDSLNIAWGGQWTAGLRLTWSLFDGLRREGQIISQKAQMRQSAIQLSDTEQRTLQEIRSAIYDIHDAKELVESQQLNLDRANEALRLVVIGSRQGVNTELEVLDARSALTRARGLYYEALHAHATARLALQRAMGILGPPPGADHVPEKGPAPGVIEEFMAAAREGGPQAPQAGQGGGAQQ